MRFRARARERRGAPRVAATGGVLITWEADGQPRQSLGQCADLSATGARMVELQDSIPVGTDVHLHFMAIDLEAEGVICHTKNTGSIGVRFARLTLFGSPIQRKRVPAYRRMEKILVGAALLFLICIFAGSYFTTGSVWTLLAPWSPAPGAMAPSPTFTLGSTPAEVRAALGAPSGVHGNSWSYGPSSVYFKEDWVVGWKGMADFPLKIRFDSANAARLGKDYFEVGATASEVAAVQGVPGDVRGDYWVYGSSEVHFRNGRVVGWKHSPQRPLKVHGAPTSP
jgi:hypothetical protein